MISKRNLFKLILPMALLITGAVWILTTSRGVVRAPKSYDDVNRPPDIKPSYHDAVIPPNIAPLNFIISEAGSRYFVRIRAEQGPSIEISSRSPKIYIPVRKWRVLLMRNRGQTLDIEIFVASTTAAGSGLRWKRFDPLRNSIAQEDIDRFIVYRKIHPAFSAWRDIGIYQRDITSFDETVVLANDSFGQDCLNCHTFCGNHTNTMLISTRSGKYGSAAVIINNGQAEKIGTRFGYTAWHPNGKIVAFANNAVALFLHSAADEVRDVIDLDSFLAYYCTDKKVIETAPVIARKDRLETYPTWSPDGHYLYFCSAPMLWKRRDVIPENYRDVKYDLVRTTYDIEKDHWGELETVLLAAKTGKSILLPRISPDGRWLLFCMCSYGCFPIYQESSDLYLMDLSTAVTDGERAFRRLDINSEHSESWHSWSSNSRWIAFSSKRDNGTFTRIYISHVGTNGIVSEPLLLPQKDPTFYDSCLNTYSVPELVVEKVPVTKERLARFVRSRDAVAVKMPITMATPKAEQYPRKNSVVQTRE